MNLKNIITPVLLALATLLSCNARENTTSQNQDIMNTNKTSKALVVFFSHAGENYSVGNIEVGNTKIVADYISEITGAQQFEIVATKNYDMPYMQLIDLAKKETQDGELPPYEGPVPDLAQFDTIFIGGPIWWGTFPQVMFTFFKENDLNGKTIYPFVTHEGSGLASTVGDIKKAYPNATVKPGFSIYGHEVRSGKGKVTNWLKGLGY